MIINVSVLSSQTDSSFTPTDYLTSMDIENVILVQWDYFFPLISHL